MFLTKEKQKTEPDFIWVEGYKGMRSDMTCFGGFQYELGQTYSISGTPEIGKNGFHFCTDLSDVFRHYEVFGGQNRFFKVKGYVQKNNFYSTVLPRSIKVASDIHIIEEVDRQEVFEAARKIYPYIKEIEDLNFCSYKQLLKSNICNKMIYMDFDDTFIDIYIENTVVSKKICEMYVDIMLLLTSGLPKKYITTEMLKLKDKRKIDDFRSSLTLR